MSTQPCSQFPFLGLDTHPKARIPAMAKDEFSIVLQVPPLVGIPAKI